MKTRTLGLIIFCALFSLALTSCAQKPKTAGSQEAIQQSKSLTEVDAQVKYLISEANAFVSSQKFDDAIKTAQYVLSNLDKQSLDAKSIIEKAQAKIKEMAAQKVQEASDAMQKKLGNLGK